MSSNDLYRRIINLWDTPRYRSKSMLSQLRPIPGSADKAISENILQYISKSTLDQIFITSKDNDVSKDNSVGDEDYQQSDDSSSIDSDFSFHKLDLSSSSDDEYCVYTNNVEVSKVMKRILSNIDSSDFGQLNVADDIFVCRQNVNRLSQVIMQLKHCQDNSIETDRNAMIDRVLRKKRIQNKLISNLSRLVGAMTRMSITDSITTQIINDDELMQIPYKCSRKDRHDHAPKKQHHHDIRRRRERERRRRRKRRHHQKRQVKEDARNIIEHKKDMDDFCNSSGESEIEQRVNQRRKRWQEMEAARDSASEKIFIPTSTLGNNPDLLAGEANNTFEEPKMASYTAAFGHYHHRRSDNNKMQSANMTTAADIPIELHKPLKHVKPKISISLNLAHPIAAAPVLNRNLYLQQQNDAHKPIQDENSSEQLSNLYSSVKFPYPVINDQRDLNTVTKVLNVKKREVELRLNDTVYQLNTQAETQPDSEITARLRQATDTLRSQVRRMDTQLDYVQTRKEIERLKLTPCKTQKDKEDAKKQITSLINRMGRLHQTMKEANRQHLKNHLKDHPHHAIIGNNSGSSVCGLDRSTAFSIDTPPQTLPPNCSVSDTMQQQDEPKRKKKKLETEKKGLANIKSKITDLISGNPGQIQANVTASGKKHRKSGLNTSNNSSTTNANMNACTTEAAMTIENHQSSSHDDFMKMLSTDEDLKNKVCIQINALAGDNPVMKVLTAEAQKRLGAPSNPSSIGNEHKDVDERSFNQQVFINPTIGSTAGNLSSPMPITTAVNNMAHQSSCADVLSSMISSQPFLFKNQEAYSGRMASDQMNLQQPYTISLTSPATYTANQHLFSDISNEPAISNNPVAIQHKQYETPGIETFYETTTGDENNVIDNSSTDEDNDNCQDRAEEVYAGFPFHHPDMHTQKCSLPSVTSGLFVPNAMARLNADYADISGLNWTMNEVSRLLSKLDTKCCIIGGPYIGRSSHYRPATQNSHRLAPFSSLSSLLFTECD
ncbi:hypothetical protein GJ496_006205 [Pomphorhynchus laevis]|nr:hypothetical protein GJ496_006205 [Pomphorhynchus laevis]